MIVILQYYSQYYGCCEFFFDFAQSIKWSKGLGLKYYFIKAVRKVFPLAFLDPEGDRGIEAIGHRQYVGGNWDEIGNLQFNFLKSKGLKPESYLLDIACGSLRLGVKAIPYLNPDHYLGIGKEEGCTCKGCIRK